MRALYSNEMALEPVAAEEKVSGNQPHLNLREPVRIRMPFKFSIQTKKQCSILNPSDLVWSNKLCQTRSNSSSIECTCAHQSIYGIYTHDDSLYFGFQHDWFYAAIVCKLIVSMGAIFIFIYRLYKKESHDILSIFSVCTIQLLTSNIFAQIM
jgi:hypothetical protein